jgi:hypothetical protein
MYSPTLGKEVWALHHDGSLPVEDGPQLDGHLYLVWIDGRPAHPFVTSKGVAVGLARLGSARLGQLTYVDPYVWSPKPAEHCTFIKDARITVNARGSVVVHDPNNPPSP